MKINIPTFLKIQGKLGNYVFYEINGKQVVRKKPTIDMEKRKNAPSYKPVRDRMSAFGGGSKIGRDLRHMLLPYSKELGDAYVCGRMGAIMQRIIEMGEGEAGMRTFDMQAHGARLHGFEFNGSGQMHWRVSTKATVNKQRTTALLCMERSEREKAAATYEGVTHYRFVVAMVVLSSYRYHRGWKRYVPVEAAFNGLRALEVSALYKNKETMDGACELKVELPNVEKLPERVKVLVCAGLACYREVNGTLEPVKGRGAMRIVKVV